MKIKSPRVLFLDIETSPIISHTWGLWDQNIALNQIKVDWHVLSWAAKWQGEKEIHYLDQRDAKVLQDDKELLRPLAAMINSADVIVTHNGKKFDLPRLNARFIVHNFKPTTPVKHVDTLQLAKRHFAFTSNKLEYLSEKLCSAKKLKHKKFPGQELWNQCLAGNTKAWDEMCRYNKQDVRALEELYDKLVPWSSALNFSLYNASGEHRCKCGAGADALQRRGYHYTETGKFQRYQCCECGSWSRDRKNLLTKKDRKRLYMGV